MNNVTFGDNEMGGYYETVAGGAGAGPTFNGRHGVHTHMTNTRITDPEILETRYYLQLNFTNTKDLKHKSFVLCFILYTTYFIAFQISSNSSKILLAVRFRRQRKVLWW